MAILKDNTSRIQGLISDISALPKDRYEQGFTEGEAAGHEAGIKSEYDRFWDAAQESGNMRHYTCAFAGFSWTDATYNPKYPIIATSNSNYLFWNSLISNTKVPIHLCESGPNNSSTFSSCRYLETIPLLVVGENTQWSSSFYNSPNLMNLTIDGVIGNGFGLNGCTKLTHDSLMSVINHLKDFVAEGLGTTKTMTLGETNLNKLTAEEKQIATDKGWTLL